MTENNTEVDMTDTSELIYNKLYLEVVNWFNRKKGYGFITVVTPDNELTNEDIFTHYTSIKTNNYKNFISR